MVGTTVRDSGVQVCQCENCGHTFEIWRWREVVICPECGSAVRPLPPAKRISDPRVARPV